MIYLFFGHFIMIFFLQIKKVFIAGTEYEAAVFDLRFDQELYLLDNFPCACGTCTNRTVPTVDERGYSLIPLRENEWYTVSVSFFMFCFVIDTLISFSFQLVLKCRK
jgi:hypothetical protein